MEVKDLKYFVAVYEAKGFLRASFVLGTVQSNVSARIRSLEKILGHRLFERRYRQIVPTQSGDTLYGYAKQLLAALHQIEKTIRLAGVHSTYTDHEQRLHAD